MSAKRVAIIGLGPGGAITIDALAQEKAFDTIRVFERREAPGGCWYVPIPLPSIRYHHSMMFWKSQTLKHLTLQQAPR